MVVEDRWAVLVAVDDGDTGQLVLGHRYGVLAGALDVLLLLEGVLNDQGQCEGC